MGKAITGFLAAVERHAQAASDRLSMFSGPRRLLLLAAAALLAPRAAPGVERMTKAQAEYQDKPMGIRMCANCSLFVEPHSCKVVEGDISPEGWCKYYAMAD